MLPIKAFEIYALLTAYVSAIFGSTTNCSGATKPSESELRAQYNRWRTIDFEHESFQLVPYYAKKLESRKDESFKREETDQKQPFRTRLSDDDKCSRRLLPKNRQGKYTGTCPHHVIMTVDFERYPVAMATTKCTCRNCYNDKFRKSKENKQRPTKCVPIPYTYKVLKQQKVNGTKVCDSEDNLKKFLYQETYETLEVGCACAFINDVTVSPNRPVTEY